MLKSRGLDGVKLIVGDKCLGMLAQESKAASMIKAKAVADELRAMKLPEAAKKIEESVE